MLGRGLFQNPADPANPLNLIGLPLTAAPDVETQNRVDVLGDVNHGGEFYLVDVGPASALSLPGLTLNGRIEGANGQEAAQSPVTIRTLGDLTLDEGASIWTTSLGAGGNDVRLSAENNANFHNNAGAGAIQVDNPAANRKDDPLIRGSRYIIYSTDPKLNIPAESPGTTSLNFNGLYSHWQASPGTILSGQPGNDDGGNGFVFSIAQAPLTDEASKFFSDIIELKPPSAVTFSTKEGEAAPEIWPWICTSSTQVYQEEADRLKQKQKRPLAWHFPELRMVSVSLRHDWDEN